MSRRAGRLLGTGCLFRRRAIGESMAFQSKRRHLRDRGQEATWHISSGRRRLNTFERR